MHKKVAITMMAGVLSAMVLLGGCLVSSQEQVVGLREGESLPDLEGTYYTLDEDGERETTFLVANRLENVLQIKSYGRSQEPPQEVMAYGLSLQGGNVLVEIPVEDGFLYYVLKPTVQGVLLMDFASGERLAKAVRSSGLPADVMEGASPFGGSVVLRPECTVEQLRGFYNANQHMLDQDGAQLYHRE